MQLDINKKGLPLLEFIFLIFGTTYYLHFELQNIFSAVAPFVALIYIAYVFFKEPSYRIVLIKLVVFALLVGCLYALLTDAGSIGANVSNRGLKRVYSKSSQYLMMFVPIVFMGRTILHATKNQMYVIITVGLIMAILFSRIALKVIEINPLLAHSMQTDILEAEGVSFTGYYFVYAFTFLVILGLLCVMYPLNMKLKWGSWGLLLYSVYFLYKTQFTLSLVTSALSCCYLILRFGKSRGFKMFSVFGGLVVILSLPYILEYIISVSSSELMNERLTEIQLFFSNSVQAKEDSDLHARLTLYGKAIGAFFHSPIWGNRTVDFDGHATFLMIWADLGVIGGIPITCMFVTGYRYIREFMDEKSMFLAPFMFQIIVMGLTNPIHASIADFIMLWYLCPLMVILFVKNKNIKI